MSDREAKPLTTKASTQVTSTPLEVVKAALEAAGYPLTQKAGIISGARINEPEPDPRKLDRPQRVAVPWVGKCPHHGGRSGDSLVLFGYEDGHVWPYCHAGCTAAQILGGVGLTVRDCWPAGIEWDDRRLAEAEALAAPLQVPEERPWPVLRDEALIGLAGDFVRAVAPHTEAGRVGLLAHFLVMFGVMIGNRPHLMLDGSRHALNEFVALVGETSRGRKGTAAAHVENAYRRAFKRVDEVIISGLVSGEGLIWEVRDPIERPKRGPDGKVTVDLVDAGVQDKRRLAMEHELSRLLRSHSMQGSSLSAVERDAWDGRVLRSLTKNGAGQRTGAVKATGAHIAIIGHITKPELLRSLSETDAANGYANRYLWLMTKRSQILSRGGGAPDLGDIPRRLWDLRGFVDGLEWDDGPREWRRVMEPIDRIGLDPLAWTVWDAVYPDLTESRPGLLGALTARGEAHVMRLSALYALLDRSTIVQVPHLLAALALWDYAEASVRHIFGSSLGDPNADAVLEAIRGYGGAGCTRTELHDYFSRNLPARELNRALQTAASQGLVRVVKEKTGGRPSERYFAWADEPSEDGGYLDLALSSFSSLNTRANGG